MRESDQKQIDGSFFSRGWRHRGVTVRRWAGLSSASFLHTVGACLHRRFWESSPAHLIHGRTLYDQVLTGWGAACLLVKTLQVFMTL